MDDLKEKLISMIQEAVGGCARHWASLIADRLIANGVALRISFLPSDIGRNLKILK